MEAVWVSGRFGVERSDSSMGVSGYTMTSDGVTKYKSAGRGARAASERLP
jgi:hypothetical protein